jgi:hypothetical protein
MKIIKRHGLSPLQPWAKKFLSLSAILLKVETDVGVPPSLSAAPNRFQKVFHLFASINVPYRRLPVAYRAPFPSYRRLSFVYPSMVISYQALVISYPVSIVFFTRFVRACLLKMVVAPTVPSSKLLVMPPLRCWKEGLAPS